MNLVYYAHSYRKEDAAVVEFFSGLMRSENLTASLDPPSDRLNSAKPERHLRSTDGMLAVLTARGSGVSPYIRYEISLCLRARKPLLVFVEDILPSGMIPARILQRRFSRNALLRQVREHRHAMRSLRSYIGDDPPAAYQPSTDKRSCLLAGHKEIAPAFADRLQTNLAARGYFTEALSGDPTLKLYDEKLQESLNCADLGVAFVDSGSASTQYFIGLLRASFVPTILIAGRSGFTFTEGVPSEYQARSADVSNFDKLWQTIENEIAISEEEYVDLNNQEQVARYSELLLTEVPRTGEYTSGLRNVFVQELNMGDQNINYGQAGSIGRESTGTLVNYASAWDQMKGQTDLQALADDLGKLRSALRQRAQTVDEDQSVAAVGEAESEAKSGRGPELLQKLAKAGKWALGVAQEIGVKVAVQALQKSMGLGG